MLRIFFGFLCVPCVYRGYSFLTWGEYFFFRKKGRRAKFYNLLFLPSDVWCCCWWSLSLQYHAHSIVWTIPLLKKEKPNGLLNVGDFCQEEEESGELCVPPIVRVSSWTSKVKKVAGIWIRLFVSHKQSWKNIQSEDFCRAISCMKTALRQSERAFRITETNLKKYSI